jgi:phosphoglycerate dehydrogenase-like enzyme
MANILVISRAIHVNEAIREKFGDQHQVAIFEGVAKADLCRSIEPAEIAITSGMGYPQKFLDDDVLAAAPKLKLIQQFGVGKEVMDIVAARNRNIWVATLPQANSIAVAEIALFLVFALAKELNLIRKAVADRVFATPLCGEVSGKTFCIVGLGSIGTTLAVRLRALGGQVVAVDRTARIGAAKSFGVSRIYPPSDMLLAFRDVDYVVLSLPLTEDTRNLIGERELAAMGPGARLVNVARGEIVHRGALENAILAGRLAGYATDVGWDEPIDPHERLWQCANVVATPHIGGTTRETIAVNLRLVEENIRLVEQGSVPNFVVSTQFDGHAT